MLLLQIESNLCVTVSIYSENSDIFYQMEMTEAERTVCNKSLTSFVCLSLAIWPECVQILWDALNGQQTVDCLILF